ncbi:hypothetical protein C3L56_05735 [Veillonellaceae bacterium M2-4]|nr:hypothetical protein [Veillonellaceae bacterium M2-4]
MNITSFIQDLSLYHQVGTFNPWRDYDPISDINCTAVTIRQRQLQNYLELRLPHASYLLIAEAAGYQGCHFSGIPLTCERMLLHYHPQIKPVHILSISPQRTSRIDCPYITNKMQRDKGMNEPTDTYVWNALITHRLSPFNVVLWNIFPFHPHKKNLFSNRTPTDKELRQGLIFTQKLLTLFQRPPHIGAIGKKAAMTLANAKINCVTMRHPANGGATLFRQQFASWITAPPHCTDTYSLTKTC